MENLDIANESEILSRIIAPQEGGLEKQVAQALLGLKFPIIDVEKMNTLAEKNRSGEISAAEFKEMEDYSRVGHLINLLQSKARQSLKNG